MVCASLRPSITGLPWGQVACALKWARVDFQQGKLLIREGRVLGQTGIPKAAGSLRDIDMLPPVREVLTAQKASSWL